jgi:hypothetical protein
VTGAASALLLVHLLAGTVDVGSPQRLMRAALALGELPAHHAGDQIGARLESEHGVAQFERAGGGAVD